MNGEPKVPFVQTRNQETEEVGYDLRPAPLRLSPRSRDTHAPRLSNEHHSQLYMAPAECGGEVKSSKISPACGLAAIVSKFEILEAMTNLEKPEISTTVKAGPRTPRKIPRHHSKHMMGENMDPSLESSQFSSGDISAPEWHNHYRERQWMPDTSTSTMVNTRSRDKGPSTAGGIATGSMHNIVAERRQIFESRTGCHTMPSKSASMPFNLYGTSLSGSSPPLTMKLRRSKTYWTTAMESDSLSEASKSQIRIQNGLQNTNNQASTNSREQTAATVDVQACGHDPLLMHSSEAPRSRSKATTAIKPRSKLFGAIDALFSREVSLHSSKEQLELPPSPNIRSNQESGEGWENDGVLQCPGSVEQSFPAQIHAPHQARREAEFNTTGNATTVTYPNFRGTVMKTVQSRVTNLRNLLNMTAKEDDELQLDLRLKRRHTGPQRNQSIHRSHAPNHSFDYDREFRLGFMRFDAILAERSYQRLRVALSLQVRNIRTETGNTEEITVDSCAQ
ncbi:hypothetical protein CGCSCA4_v012462 [Colletotrichum siamense]|uniref:Uncharacterized protein n=1 Tax=Colletotrichum siamense TaxID=690259 RepID=A0A9P5BL76_COLSI|nr:hypothetical protein CGCSCA4_v012462 [Colletotrichum siamense]KAF4841564.1 hypothetical protein CGCSCA2_v014808 [Colletotrichum siamense]